MKVWIGIACLVLALVLVGGRYLKRNSRVQQVVASGAESIGIGNICIYGRDESFREAPLVEGSVFFVEIVALKATGCISSKAIVSNASIEKVGANTWNIAGGFKSGSPPYTPDCGGGRGTFELGLLAAGAYTVSAGDLNVRFEVKKAGTAEPTLKIVCAVDS